MSLGLLCSAILAGTSGGMFLVRKFLGARARARANNIEEIIRRHAAGDFSDWEESSGNEPETNNKTPDLHPVYHTILLTGAIACGITGYHDKLPYSVQRFNSYTDGQEVLSEEECQDLMDSLDTDRNGLLSIKEFSQSEKYYDDLSWWGINGFRSKINLREVQNDILYRTEGKLPPKKKY